MTKTLEKATEVVDLEAQVNNNGSIIFDDCRNVFSKMADESIDLIVSDVPYKIMAGGIKVNLKGNEPSGILNGRSFVSDGSPCSNKWLKKNPLNTPSAVRAGKMFEHNEIKFEEFLPEMYRVLKQDTHCYLMINARNLKELQQKAEDVGFKFQNLLIWNKGNATPNGYYMQCCEFILMLKKGKSKPINDMGTQNLLSVPNIIGQKAHPTEKPVGLLEILIKNSSNEGDLVLDPFAGSCSLAEACINTNRQYICIETDKQYYDLGKKRVEGKSYRPQKNQEQVSLF